MRQRAMTLTLGEQQATVRAFLSTHPVATSVQLGRLPGVGEAALARLPRVTYTCRVRARHEDSEQDLTFLSLRRATLRRAPRELMHDAALTELRLRLAALRPELSAYHWSTALDRSVSRARQPDAELHSGRADRQGDYAVEIDAGYPGQVRRAKLRAFDEGGYHGAIWGTTVHARTMTLPGEARGLGLTGLRGVEVYYLNFWSAGDPYGHRPRCHKPAAGAWVNPGAG